MTTQIQLNKNLWTNCDLESAKNNLQGVISLLDAMTVSNNSEHIFHNNGTSTLSNILFDVLFELDKFLVAYCGEKSVELSSINLEKIRDIINK